MTEPREVEGRWDFRPLPALPRESLVMMGAHSGPQGGDVWMRCSDGTWRLVGWLRGAESRLITTETP